MAWQSARTQASPSGQLGTSRPCRPVAARVLSRRAAHGSFNVVSSKPPPRGSGGSTEVEAIVKARASAANVIDKLLDILESPDRHAGSQISAARLILETAGVGATLADERHTELLRILRKHLSAEAYGEVVRALANGAGLPAERTGSPLDN